MARKKYRRGWHTDDILMEAKELGYKISVEKANEILDHIDRNFDPEIGINWHVIDIYIEEHMEEQE